MGMPQRADYRLNAAKCRELAVTADPETAAKLRMLADEYEELARLEGDPDAQPPNPVTS